MGKKPRVIKSDLTVSEINAIAQNRLAERRKDNARSKKLFEHEMYGVPVAFGTGRRHGNGKPRIL
jgi:hypothetical protein